MFQRVNGIHPIYLFFRFYSSSLSKVEIDYTFLVNTLFMKKIFNYKKYILLGIFLGNPILTFYDIPQMEIGISCLYPRLAWGNPWDIPISVL